MTQANGVDQDQSAKEIRCSTATSLIGAPEPVCPLRFTDGYEIHFVTRYQPVSMNGLATNSLSLDFGMNFYFDL